MKKKIISPRCIVAVTIAQFHLSQPEFRLCAGSNDAHGVLEICIDVNL